MSRTARSVIVTVNDRIGASSPAVVKLEVVK